MVANRLLLLGLLVTAGGCVTTGEIGYDCDPSIYEEGHLGPDGKPDFCHRRDPPDTGSVCTTGVCLSVPTYWNGPLLLWSGLAGQAPECPSGPTGLAWQGHSDLVVPDMCEACTCAPPTGSCALPETLTASTTACNALGDSTSFNAPPAWDGQCDTAVQVPAGAATSLTIGTLTVLEKECLPGAPTIPGAAKVAAAYWAKDAQSCHGPGFLPCLNMNSACAPVEDPDNFRVCITREGESECPELEGGVFSERLIFYQGINDDRQCSECTCGQPTGSVCRATIAVYSGADLTCSDSALETKLASSVVPVCLDFALPGQALGSKSAGATTYAPGTCKPLGGEPSGGATARESFTFCCRPTNPSQPAP